LNVAMLIRSPTSWFISVDFPTLGFPTIFTNPALCINKNIEIDKKRTPAMIIEGARLHIFQ
jgi:hypothetical protein